MIVFKYKNTNRENLKTVLPIGDKCNHNYIFGIEGLLCRHSRDSLSHRCAPVFRAAHRQKAKTTKFIKFRAQNEILTYEKEPTMLLYTHFSVTLWFWTLDVWW